MQKQYYVYILTNKNHTVLYTGVSANLKRRVYEHRNFRGSVFTTKYKTRYLVYYEVFKDSYNAISRKKQLKSGSKAKKISLIEEFNPEWKDLYPDI